MSREPVALDKRPSFAVTIATILLPVVLMLAKAFADIVIDDPENTGQQVFDVIGAPFIALLIGVLVAMVTFGANVGMDRTAISETVSVVAAPHRRDPADRLRRRWVQAGARRHRQSARSWPTGRATRTSPCCCSPGCSPS